VLDLLSDAVKFSPPGGKVEVGVGIDTESDGALAILVRDEGITRAVQRKTAHR